MTKASPEWTSMQGAHRPEGAVHWHYQKKFPKDLQGHAQALRSELQSRPQARDIMLADGHGAELRTRAGRQATASRQPFRTGYPAAMHLLLVEDDLDLGRSLQQALAGSGHTSVWLRTLAEAEAVADSGQHECVLLDLNLPDGHGLDLLRRWRARGLSVPLIVITASDSLGDRLLGLDEGADDFIVKPFAVEELVSRVHAVTRRVARQASTVWQFGDMVLDPNRRECRCSGIPVALSPREWDILAALARSVGRVVPKHRLAQAVSPLGDPLDFGALEVHVHNLRRKLGATRVKTVRGVGYLLEETLA